MNFGFKITKIFVFLLLFIPSFTLAGSVCSKDGYTVLTMNGIFNSEARAQENRNELALRFDTTFNNQPIVVDFVHNPSHLAGLGDVFKAAYQGLLDDETIQDYDLTEMLVTASQKITTQKVLIVAHSQGNFYANSFYDVVAGQKGGIPKESIGVYAVATPSGRTSGNGLWLTSTTDKVIAGTVGRTLRRKIMTPNTTIDLTAEPESSGHGFSEIYLKYRSERIVGDIEKSLNLLQNNSIQEENGPCMNPPEISLAHKVTGVLFTVADPLAGVGVSTAVGAYDVSNLVLKTSGQVVGLGLDGTVLLYGVSNAVLETGGKVVVFGINTAEYVLGSVGSFVYNSGKLLANTASSFFQPNSNNIITISDQLNSNTEVGNNKPDKNKVVKKVVEPKVTMAEEEIIESESVEEEVLKQDIPEFIEIVPVDPKVNPGGKIRTANTPQNNSTIGILQISQPNITVPLCSSSLSVIGCLVSTTTVDINWLPQNDVKEYEIYLNGEFSTTTQTSITLNLEDFKDYFFEVVPVSTNPENTTSTSTVSFSVATMPIAINEIAFWGTMVSDNDEWLELKNNTNHSIDLSKWALKINNNETTLPLSGTILPKSYVLVMRGENSITVNNDALILGWDESIQNILNDTGEKMFLFYGENNFDSTPNWNYDDGTDVYDTGYKRTIERKKSRLAGDSFSNWEYNLDFIRNGEDAENEEVFATPGEHNSVSYLINDGETLITEDLILDAENGPYAVFDTIIVTASSTLTIPEGVVVYFIKDTDGVYGNFYVPGRVVAGGDGSPVSFIGTGPNPEGFFWFSSNQATSTFQNVSFENTETIGLINNSKVEVKNSSFIENGSGINAYNGATLVLENVTIASTTGEAVAGYSNTTVSIASSTIVGTFGADAVSVYNDSSLVLDNVIIENSGHDGVASYNESTVSINNVLVNNTANDGIAMYDSVVSISSTTVNTSANNGVGLYKATTTINQITITNSQKSSLFVVGGEVHVEDSIIHDSQDGYAIEVISQNNKPMADVEISSSIIVGDTNAVFENSIGSIVMDSTVFCESPECLAN